MTRTTEELLKESFELIPQKEELAQRFYAMLFDLYPDTRLMFPEDMKEQERKLFITLRLLVTEYGQPRLVTRLQGLGRYHAKRGITTREQYNIVGGVLLNTLKLSLVESWTTAYEDAWTTAYSFAVQMMLSTADDVTSIPTVEELETTQLVKISQVDMANRRCALDAAGNLFKFDIKYVEALDPTEEVDDSNFKALVGGVTAFAEKFEEWLNR